MPLLVFKSALHMNHYLMVLISTKWKKNIFDFDKCKWRQVLNTTNFLQIIPRICMAFIGQKTPLFLKHKRGIKKERPEWASFAETFAHRRRFPIVLEGRRCVCAPIVGLSIYFGTHLPQQQIFGEGLGAYNTFWGSLISFIFRIITIS